MPRSASLVCVALCGIGTSCSPTTCTLAELGLRPYDLLIQHATVVDGTGAPRYSGDVLLCGDLIGAAGYEVHGSAHDTINALGLVVAPGFIDMLGHSEYRLLEDGSAISKITQGITTEITGEVTSVVPVNDSTLRYLDYHERDRVTWTDLNAYFRALENSGTAINLGTFVALGSVRTAVMGKRANEPTPSEMEEMKELVADAMEQGAMGLSTGLLYPPASSATRVEIVELARVAAAYGGSYASHIRSEGDQLIESIEEAIHIGESAGARVHIHHLKAAGHRNWGKMEHAIQLIEEARARGVQVTADQYPYAASSTSLSSVLPAWVHAGGNDAMLERVRDPLTRDQLRVYLRQRWLDWHNGADSTGPGSVLIANVRTKDLHGYVGMRLSEVATLRTQEVEDTYLDLLSEDNGQTAASFFSMSEADIEYAMQKQWVSVGVDAGATGIRSAGLPHPRTFGTFPRILGRYVRERGLLTLETAIHKFTAVPASQAGLRNRGTLKPGYYADITVFDPGTVSDRATFEHPVQLSEGIAHVIVNGTLVLRDGKPTGARPGRGLRRH